jgi:hypothetical protein
LQRSCLRLFRSMSLAIYLNLLSRFDMAAGDT